MTEEPDLSPSATDDVVDRLVDIHPGTQLDLIRRGRSQARDNIQKSYLALFQPRNYGGFPSPERLSVAAFVAGLHREPKIAAFYEAEINSSEPELAALIAREASRGHMRGPYGRYPAGPLSDEDKPGLAYRVDPEHRRQIGERLAAGLEHAHLLAFHPRDAKQDALELLCHAGWSTTDIVTLSQLVAFLSFQIRVIAGLRKFAAAL